MPNPTLQPAVAGAGKLMLLLHGINAAASVREMKPAFDHAVRSRLAGPDP